MKMKTFLNGRRISYRTYKHPKSYDSQRLAAALHVSGRDVAKTVLLRADGSYRYFLAVLPATKHVDLQRLKAALSGAEVTLAPEGDVAKCAPDCESGILPPFGSQFGAETIVDESLVGQRDIFFQGDTHDEAIRISYRDFCDVEHPLVLSIARNHAEVKTGRETGVVD
jgi:Ala-tRNA(Pro) deacylase